jgi:MATE family multidrug resistance protein
MVLTAQANGAGEYGRCGAIWRVALLHALVLSLVFAMIAFVAEDIFLAIGQTPELARGAADVTFHFAWGMPGMMMYVASGYLLEGIGRPRAGMIIMLAANVVNVLADGIFAVGWWGLVEPMGALGAVITTSAIRWGIFVAILIVILTRPDRALYGITGTATPVRAIAGRMWKLGIPSAATGFLENGAYATLAQLAGLLGATALAAHQVTINVLTLAYMGANGMAAATSVRVGFAVGRGDRAGVALSGWTGIGLGTALMGGVALLFLLAPTAVADIFLHTDRGSLAIAEHTVVAAGVFIVFAGAMASGMGALRGAGDMIAVMGCYALAYAAMGIPAAWTFAFHLGWGAPGLIYGLLAGVLAGLALILWRFSAIAGREVRRA